MKRSRCARAFANSSGSVTSSITIGEGLSTMCNLLLGSVTDVLPTFYQHVSCSSHQHGPPLLGRVSCLAVPRRQCSYAALRLPAPISHGSGSPCQWPTSMQALVLCLVADDTCACSRVVRRDDPPALREVLRQPIAEAGARLATGLGDLTLRRTGFAPAGRRTKFHEGITTSNPL